MSKSNSLDEKTLRLQLEVRKIFSAFLTKKNQRKTPERFAILEEIYTQKKHFDVEKLHQQMNDKKYRVSLATVYNTLELLIDCQLVKKHQFGKNIATYEQSYGYRQHDHLICLHCNKVLEFCDPRIQQINTTMGNLLGFNVSHHSLQIYANPISNDNNECQNCQKNITKSNE